MTSNDFLMQNYARYPLTVVRGEGSYIFDDAGNRYLDFISGIAVNTLGHAHPKMVAAIADQAASMLHCSNLFHIPQQQMLAQRLCTLAGLGGAFFCNSGAEANEAAIKLARKFWFDQNIDRFHIITATNSFHGRTLTTLTATGQEKVKQGFSPLPPGFSHVPLGDFAALEAEVSDVTAAIMLEPIQGEGGVRSADIDYLRDVRQLCDETGTLLILDEIQTGIGRTGSMFGFEHAATRPDILTLAKGLGGGVPIGAMLATEKVAAHLTPGSHGSTFGGNPLCCAAALAVLDVVEEKKLVENAHEQGGRLLRGLANLESRFANIVAVRGRGLLVGLEFEQEVAATIGRCRDKGLLVLPAGPKVLRILPPLNVSADEIDEALEILEQVLVETEV